MISRGYSKYEENSDLNFTEQWCTDLEKSAIEHSWNRVKDLEGDAIEIGCFEGRSTVFTANLIYPATLIAIDPWVPHHEDAPYEIEVYGKRPIKEHFDHNIKVGTAGNVEVNAMRWEDFFESYKKLADRKIRYLYLDGPHSYENVMESLEVLTPLFVEGGVMIGDDYDHPPVRKAVDEFFGGPMRHPVSGRTFEWIND